MLKIRAEKFSNQCATCAHYACENKTEDNICKRYEHGQYCVCTLIPVQSEETCKYYINIEEIAFVPTEEQPKKRKRRTKKELS